MVLLFSLRLRPALQQCKECKLTYVSYEPTGSYIDFELKLWPDSVKSTSAGNYVDYFLNLRYIGDEDDSFHFLVRSCFNPDWRIELWDTAYIDTIPWYIKLDAGVRHEEDTVFYARLYAPEDAVVGDSNVTILYTKTRECSRDMEDSVILITHVVGPGVYETRIERPAALTVAGISNVGLASFALPSGEVAHLTVYDATGRQVYAREVEGSGRIEWSGASTCAGLYFVRLEHAKGTISRKIVLMR